MTRRVEKVEVMRVKTKNSKSRRGRKKRKKGEDFNETGSVKKAAGWINDQTLSETKWRGNDRSSPIIDKSKSRGHGKPVCGRAKLAPTWTAVFTHSW